jgi:hypothetical protein
LSPSRYRPGAASLNTVRLHILPGTIIPTP